MNKGQESHSLPYEKGTFSDPLYQQAFSLAHGEEARVEKIYEELDVAVERLAAYNNPTIPTDEFKERAGDIVAEAAQNIEKIMHP